GRAGGAGGGRGAGRRGGMGVTGGSYGPARHAAGAERLPGAGRGAGGDGAGGAGRGGAVAAPATPTSAGALGRVGGRLCTALRTRVGVVGHGRPAAAIPRQHWLSPAADAWLGPCLVGAGDGPGAAGGGAGA